MPRPYPGLSPRVRGSRINCSHDVFPSGSIPACAGEPGGRDQYLSIGRVYPRVCGGAGTDMGKTYDQAGLSPRVRGSRVVPGVWHHVAGSIPACAGEPCTAARSRLAPRVYPRVCGGACDARRRRQHDQGLSPRVRGSQRQVAKPTGGMGSIPACAGEPASSAAAWGLARVYPRVCGGAILRILSTASTWGLSPRVRGSPGTDAFLPAVDGSIPACAGEPSRLENFAGRGRVYPRVCGGAQSRCARRRSAPGLSPRVRGSRQRSGPITWGSGSIPACAGEPARCVISLALIRVYPRVCGGAQLGGATLGTSTGLSPRVRGSPGTDAFLPPVDGSIPACAGEPLTLEHNSLCRRVYPRVCGGASTSGYDATQYRGLSPRVRGSLALPTRPCVRNGSIPACAGEPLHLARTAP